MKRYLDLNDRAFYAIKNGTKRVEIRANTGNNDFSKYEIGNIIIFKNSENKTINCKIKEIMKVVCIGSNGETMMPCGACMEYMMQLSEDSENIEILKRLENKEYVRLKELIPVWWGKVK